MADIKASVDVKFTFGAIADVQCGDLDDRINDCAWKKNRYYRAAIRCLREAVDYWNQRSSLPSFILQLGDLLDGYNAQIGGKAQSRCVLDTILQECSSFKGEFHHAWGNHELYNFTRLELLNSSLFSGRRYITSCHPSVYGKLHVTTRDDGVPFVRSMQTHKSSHIDELTENIDAEHHGVLTFADETIPAYYHFSPHYGFRFILLDTYEVSILGHGDECSPSVTAALSILQTYNKNENLSNDVRLEGYAKRFVDYNGGMSSKQLQWLEQVLRRATLSNEKVILFGHIPILPEVSSPCCLLWNYEEVLDIVQSSSCVVAVLSGHTHEYCHRTDVAGIHHLVLPAVVECQPGTNGYATFDVSLETMTLHGNGEMPSRVELRFR